MKKYYGIDWLRAVACIGIMLMHMSTNNTYAINGFVYQRLIPSFTDFVYLFMAVSAFGMCCGYYSKVMSGQVNWTEFYKKRYSKILPFFLLLVLIELVLKFSIPALYEGTIEVTLLHGFIPNSLDVVGVGWFLGTVFVFYLIFPFFCVLIETKLRAWCAFAVSIVLNFICSSYFDLQRTNIIYSLCFFLAGGLIYLYKDRLENLKWYISVPATVLASACYYLIGDYTLTRLFVTITLLICGISFNFGKVKVISFISNISLEIYLSHMVVFRAIEMFRLNKMFGNGWLQYIATVVMVLVGTIAFSFVCQQIIKKSQALLKKKI